jgi:hypothetical protein
MTERRTAPPSSVWTLTRWAGFALAGGRTALGVVAILRPELPARPWIGAATADRPEAKVLARALGGRDIALGLVVLRSLLRADPTGGAPDAAAWTGAAALADATDFVATVLAWRSLPRIGRVLVAAVAGGAVVVGGVAAARLAAPQSE